MYDLIIVGGSAAATGAGIYAARRNLNFKIISKDFGGEVATSGEIGNYPGVPDTDGITLSQKFKDHLASYNVKPETGIWVKKISKMEDGTFCIEANKGDATGSASEKMEEGADTQNKCDYTAKAVIVTTGVHPRPLDVPGEKEFKNKGVSYCTTCDGPLFQGKVTATIGGGNSALESAIMMSGIAKKHYVININPQFKGEQILIDKLQKMENVEIIYNAETTEIVGDQLVKGLKYKDKESGEEKQIEVEGVFINIGTIPNSNVVTEDVTKNKFGEIEVNLRGETNVPGLFAAGDVTSIPFKQIAIASGQGVSAVLSAIEYINRLES